MFPSKTLDVTYCKRPLTGFFFPCSDVKTSATLVNGHLVCLLSFIVILSGHMTVNYFSSTSLKAFWKNYHAKCYRVFEAHFNNTFSANFVPVFPLLY